MKFETWLEEQEESVQGMIQDHISGLTSALESEREGRKKLEGQLREVTSELEEGSEMRQRIEAMASDLDQTSAKVGFYELAHEEGVKNLSLAYLAAKEKDLLDDVDGLKESYPELFLPAKEEKKPRGNVGRGRQRDDELKSETSMDDIIRGAQE